MLTNKILAVWLPVLTVFSTILNGLLSGLGFHRVYLALMIISICGILIFKRVDFGRILNVSIMQYVVVLTALSLLSALSDVSANALSSAWFLYVGFALYWTVYYAAFDVKHVPVILRYGIYGLVVSSIIGCIQFFYSPSFFGLLQIDAEFLEWAEKGDFEAYKIFFRAYSTMGSPQVFGLIMAFGVSLCFLLPGIKIFIRIICAVILVAGGILSATKSFILILALFAIISGIRSIARGAVKSIIMKPLLAFSLLVVVAQLSSGIPVLERVIEYNAIVSQENEDSRLGRFLYIIQETPLFGFGAGSQFGRKETGTLAAESYLLYVYYELGFIGVLSLIGLWVSAFKKSVKRGCEMTTTLLFLLFTSWTFVHAFVHPVFFMMWAVVIGALRGRFRDITFQVVAKDAGRFGRA